jgi:hypothetical protein
MNGRGLVSKRPNIAFEIIYFSWIPIVHGDEILNRRFEPGDRSLLFRQISRIHNFRHSLSLPKARATLRAILDWIAPVPPT